MIYYDVIIFFVISTVKLSHLAKSIQTKNKNKNGADLKNREDCVIEIEQNDKSEDEKTNFVFRIDGPYGSAHQVKEKLIYFEMIEK